MSVLSLLNSGNFQMYNRAVARELGSVNAAIFLSEMINRYEFHQQEKTLFVEDGIEWFYYTHELGTDRLCLSRKEQDAAVKVLTQKGFVEKCVKGLPAKRYFTLNHENIVDCFLNSKNVSRMSKRDKLECPKGTNQGVPKGQTIYRYKNSREELKEEKKGAAAAGAPSQTAEAAARISSFLADEIKERYPNNKPKTKNWIKEIELMLRIDGRSEEKVIEVLKWVRKSRFWRKTILSPTSLRNSFDRLQAGVEEEKNSPEEEKKLEEKKKLDMVEENKKYALELHKKHPHPKINISGSCVLIPAERGNGKTPLNCSENGFKEQLYNAYLKARGQ